MGEIPMKRLGELREFAALAAFLVPNGQLTSREHDSGGRWMDSPADLSIVKIVIVIHFTHLPTLPLKPEIVRP